jgi:hypothetical protein
VLVGAGVWRFGGRRRCRFKLDPGVIFSLMLRSLIMAKCGDSRVFMGSHTPSADFVLGRHSVFFTRRMNCLGYVRVISTKFYFSMSSSEVTPEILNRWKILLGAYRSVG